VEIDMVMAVTKVSMFLYTIGDGNSDDFRLVNPKYPPIQTRKRNGKGGCNPFSGLGHFLPLFQP
jgi:hypothetical protein